MNAALFLLAVALVFLPFGIAMTRQMDAPATLAIIGAPLVFPVVGWFVALAVALTLPRRRR